MLSMLTMCTQNAEFKGQQKSISIKNDCYLVYFKHILQFMNKTPCIKFMKQSTTFYGGGKTCQPPQM